MAKDPKFVAAYGAAKAKAQRRNILLEDTFRTPYRKLYIIPYKRYSYTCTWAFMPLRAFVRGEEKWR